MFAPFELASEKASHEQMATNLVQEQNLNPTQIVCAP
jgi:hypothetical protein